MADTPKPPPAKPELPSPTNPAGAHEEDVARWADGRQFTGDELEELKSAEPAKSEPPPADQQESQKPDAQPAKSKKLSDLNKAFEDEEAPAVESEEEMARRILPAAGPPVGTDDKQDD